MSSTPFKQFIVFSVVCVQLFGSAGYAAAATPEIRLIVNPKQASYYAGAGKVALTAKAAGANLTFTWKSDGPGTLEGQGAARFYAPPATCVIHECS